MLAASKLGLCNTASFGRTALIDLKFRRAIDGLWYSEVFQLGAPDEPRRTQVVEALLAMTRSPN